MTRDLRERIRQAIDARARERREIAHTPSKVCRRCGTDHDTYTSGCITCTNRRLNRVRMARAKANA